MTAPLAGLNRSVVARTKDELPSLVPFDDTPQVRADGRIRLKLTLSRVDDYHRLVVDGYDLSRPERESRQWYRLVPDRRLRLMYG